MFSTAKRPFKKFYCDRPDIFLIPAPAFKIWMYHYSREGRERQSWPSIETICEKLAMTKDTIHKWRSWLVENGWLEKVGERENSTGVFKVPIMKVKRGNVPSQQVVDGRKNNVPPSPSRKKSDTAPSRNNSLTVGRKKSLTARSEKIRPEVDSELQVHTFEEEADAFFHSEIDADTLTKGTSVPTSVPRPSRNFSYAVVKRTLVPIQPHERAIAQAILDGREKPASLYAPWRTLAWAKQLEVASVT
jgi:hypothetical protein